MILLVTLLHNNNDKNIVLATLGTIIAPAKSATRPDSSSSFFAPIENLTDSTIRTKIAVLPQPPQKLILGPNPFFAAIPPNTQLNDNFFNFNINLNDSVETIESSLLLQQRLNNALKAHHEEFDTLIHRLLLPLTDRQVFSPDQSKLVTGFLGHGKAVAADENNKTVMQFFRNNKTFASIVYTNEEQRRLLNCHLVDLERHASDVALFEARYDMSTNDIGFKEMMNLIESCTNIARQRRPNNASSNSPQQPQIMPPIGIGGGALTPQRTPLVIGRAPPSKFVPTQPGNDQQQQQQSSSARTLFPLINSPRQQQQQQPINNMDTTQSPSAKPSSSVKIKTSTGKIKEALKEITYYDTRDLFAIWRGILPGTNWCGMGDRATSYNDLGIESDLDICCRAHDFCPIRLNAFSRGYGLFNWSFYTRSHCLCDENFLVCLKRAHTPLADVVAKFYFNIMRTTCIHDNETSTDGPSLPLGPPYNVGKFDDRNKLAADITADSLHRQDNRQRIEHSTIKQRLAKSSKQIDRVLETKPPLLPSVASNQYMRQLDGKRDAFNAPSGQMQLDTTANFASSSPSAKYLSDRSPDADGQANQHDHNGMRSFG